MIIFAFTVTLEILLIFLLLFNGGWKDVLYWKSSMIPSGRDKYVK